MATDALSGGGFVELTSQVGGHPGVLSSADGSVIIKPCLIPERDFYERLKAAGPGEKGLHDLRPLCPVYHGTVFTEGEDGKDEFNFCTSGPKWHVLERVFMTDRTGFFLSIVLENLSKAFTKPNILDIKLGTVLYDEHASEEKKARMIKTAAETTSLETGVRMTGFQVYDSVSGEYVVTPKTYGKALKVSQLPEAFAKFFPVAPPTLNISTATSTNDTTPASHPAGLPPTLLLPILKGILVEIQAIEEAFQEIELRMVGGSALIIYEGDVATVKKALAAVDGTTEVIDDVVDSTTTEDLIDGEGIVKHTQKSVIPAYKVKMIDFAHTKIVPGEGKDEGVLLGLSNVIKNLQGRIKEVEEIIGSSAQLAA